MIFDGTVVRLRLDKRATNIAVLAAIGMRRDGQKVLLSVKSMGGESPSSSSDRPTGPIRPALPDRPRPWRRSGGLRGPTGATVRPHLDARGLRRPGFVVVDGAPGLETARASLTGRPQTQALRRIQPRPPRPNRPERSSQPAAGSGMTPVSGGGGPSPIVSKL